MLPKILSKKILVLGEGVFQNQIMKSEAITEISGNSWLAVQISKLEANSFFFFFFNLNIADVFYTQLPWYNSHAHSGCDRKSSRRQILGYYIYVNKVSVTWDKGGSDSHCAKRGSHLEYHLSCTNHSGHLGKCEST